MDVIRFDNLIHYMVVGPGCEIISQGQFCNAVGYKTKDRVLRALTQNYQTTTGTEVQVNRMYFRNDGGTTLGSFLLWCPEDSATVISTRYSNSTYVTSVMFSGTYTATANITCKAVALTEKTQSSSDDVGSFAQFYSTNLNVSLGSASKLIIDWMVSI
jgi:hypothetical protein